MFHKHGCVLAKSGPSAPKACFNDFDMAGGSGKGTRDKVDQIKVRKQGKGKHKEGKGKGGAGATQWPGQREQDALVALCVGCRSFIR